MMIGAYNPYISPLNMTYRTEPVNSVAAADKVSNSGKVSPAECQTCKNRKYQDGSDEMVSFKSPAHISPEASFAMVSAHEQEHVSNAVAEGSKENKELVSATVSLKMAVCPECGRTYVAGGVTSTKMRTYAKDPYSQNLKSFEKEALTGNYIDYCA